MIKVYREALSDKTAGEQIAQVINKMKKFGYQIGGQHFKRLPKGFDENFPHADLLLHNGLYCYLESKEIKQLKPKTVVDFCFKHFKAMLPIHSWLADILPLFR